MYPYNMVHHPCPINSGYVGPFPRNSRPTRDQIDIFATIQMRKRESQNFRINGMKTQRRRCPMVADGITLKVIIGF